MDLGGKLKYYRLVNKDSQMDFADKLGVDKNYYSKIERNCSSPTIKKLEAMCTNIDLELAELFLSEIKVRNSDFLNPNICKLIIESLKNDMDIHFNREALFNNCESSIWYSGYVGSLSFDEFEMKIYADGNIKARLFINFQEVLELNSQNISNELMKYIDCDEKLYKIIKYNSYDADILNEMGGNVLFIYENNWWSAEIINNVTNSVVQSEIIFDSDNIIECLQNRQMLLDNI